MKKFVSFFLLFLTSLVYFAQAPASVDFSSDSFDQLKAKAKAENKPFFISFHTSWSTPCKNMNNNTYPNAALASYVSDNYLAKKVDAESTEDNGIVLADRFDVTFFPTIIIFDPNGKEVGKLLGFKNASELKNELKKFEVKQKPKKKEKDPPKKEIAENKPPAKNNTNTTKQPTTTPKKTTTNKATSSTPKKEPVKPVTTFEPVVKTNNQSTITRTRSAPAKTPSSESNSATLQPVNSRSGLYKISMSDQPGTGIGVQVGVYGDYANVLKQVAYLEDTYKQNILVNIADMGDKTVFKIIVGPFSSRGQADGFKKVFEKREKRKTMVIDLDSFQ